MAAIPQLGLMLMFYLSLLIAAREDALRLRKLVEQEKGKAMKGAAIGDPEDADVNRGVDSFKSVSLFPSSGGKVLIITTLLILLYYRSSTMRNQLRHVDMSILLDISERKSMRMMK